MPGRSEFASELGNPSWRDADLVGNHTGAEAKEEQLGNPSLQRRQSSQPDWEVDVEGGLGGDIHPPIVSQVPPPPVAVRDRVIQSLDGEGTSPPRLTRQDVASG